MRSLGYQLCVGEEGQLGEGDGGRDLHHHHVHNQLRVGSNWDCQIEHEVGGGALAQVTVKHFEGEPGEYVEEGLHSRSPVQTPDSILGEEAKAKARIWEQRGDEFYSKISQQRFDEVNL